MAANPRTHAARRAKGLNISMSFFAGRQSVGQSSPINERPVYRHLLGLLLCFVVMACSFLAQIVGFSRGLPRHLIENFSSIQSTIVKPCGTNGIWRLNLFVGVIREKRRENKTPAMRRTPEIQPDAQTRVS